MVVTVGAQHRIDAILHSEKRNTDKESSHTQTHQPCVALGHVQLVTAPSLELTLCQTDKYEVRAQNHNERTSP